MGRSSRFAFALLSVGIFGGCNALLGTESGVTKSNGNGGDPDASAAEPDGGHASNDGGPSSSTRNDSKPPCNACEVGLVVKTQGTPRHVTVRGDYVYFTDYYGVFRVKRTDAPCTTDACKEVIATTDSATDACSVAVSDTLVCWTTNRQFGCANLDLSGRKEVDANKLGIVGSRMRFDGDTLYLVRGFDNYATPQTLARVNALGFAAGTASPTDVSETNAEVHAFTLSADAVAWGQEKSTSAIAIEPLSGGSTVSIPLPSDYSTTNGYTNDLALYDGRIYIAPDLGQHVYRAPADGSAEAVPLLDVDGARFVAVDASGVYVAHGGQANYTNGIVWSPLDPKAPGAAGKKTLVTPDGKVSSFDIGDDGLYFGDDRNGNSAVRRIAFD